MFNHDRKKILYVDDEQINLELFRLAFKSTFEVLIADSGKLGLQILGIDKDIRLVLSDMKMPAMDGIQFIQKVKEFNKEIPCIILSGYEITPSIKTGIESGLIVDYITKPFNKEQLKQLVQKTIE
jgi:two-component system, response regulator, stage 0 sporulation protein F